MSRTTRPSFPPGSRRARNAGPWHGRFAARIFLFAALASEFGISSAAHAQQDASDMATAGFYLLSGSGHQQGPFTGAVNTNNFLGAERFYNAGFTGTNAVIANIEAGHVWNGHETLSHVAWIPTSPGAVGDVDRHATWVAMVLAGRPAGPDAGDHQRGMAPDATLVSGAIATGWPNNESFPRYTATFNVNFNTISTYGPYRAAFISGVTGPGGTRTADVVNSSFVGSSGFQALTGSDRFAGTLDALISENPRTLVTVAAGNTTPSGEGPNRVPSPASGFNNMAVAALTPNGGTYDDVSRFSNGGPNDYSDPSGGFESQARQVIDIAAPGENFSVAYYGGQTGGNGPNVFGPVNGPDGGPDWYTRNVSGTSFASPTVGGGAALLYDAAYTLLSGTPEARDARVMKAVLMNSADKTTNWDNGQVSHDNGNGGVLTTRGLDDRVGAGRLNLNAAFQQFLGGTTDVAGTQHGSIGLVNPVGWDYGEVAEGMTNDYLINGLLQAGATFNATLTWFRDRTTNGTTNFNDVSYDNLDLELWSALGGAPLNLISESMSRYNNSEHFSFAIPVSGQYMLRVRWTEELFDLAGDMNMEHYGIAWAVAVPEPASFVLVVIALLMMPLRSSRRMDSIQSSAQ